jgi:cytochrome c-type biogenesis protein CcmH
VLAVLLGQLKSGDPDRLIADALRPDKKFLLALALAGSAAFERRDFAAARRYWQQALDLAPTGSEFAAGLERSLAAAQDRGAEAAPTATTATPAPAAAAARITGRVSLAPALTARVAPTDTVFVFARNADGPRMPLAIVRRTVADLPFDFTLDDSLAMSPQTRLSGASRVIVGARISSSGDAMPQAGDLQGESAAIGTNRVGVDLVIDRSRP